MLKSVFRKIANNFWLFFCLILGSLLITAILAAIPIYTDGALRKMLTNELDKFANENDEYVSPGEVYFKIDFRSEYSPLIIPELIKETDAEIHDAFEESKMKINDSFSNLKISSLRMLDSTLNQSYSYDLQYLTGFENHVEILEGRMCSEQVTDGVIEVIVSKEEYNSNYFVLDTVYTMYPSRFGDNEERRIQY